VPLGDATIEIIGSTGRPATGRSQTVSVNGPVNEDLPITATEAEQLMSRRASLPATGIDPQGMSLVAFMMLAAGAAMTSKRFRRRTNPRSEA
jgi:LPXTG-motif cell wall-anchored protein